MVERSATMSDKQSMCLAVIETFVRSECASDTTGHDWKHICRVRDLALAIARVEEADALLVEIIALVHDVADAKLVSSQAKAKRRLKQQLEAVLDLHQVEQVLDSVGAISFRGPDFQDQHINIETDCVRDADRLDALGAIGIARTFTFGGHTGRLIGELPSPAKSARCFEATTIDHCLEKLLVLRPRMTTTLGRELARRRHAFLEQFLQEFQFECEQARSGVLD
jgi:uncharacterized protein